VGSRSRPCHRRRPRRTSRHPEDVPALEDVRHLVGVVEPVGDPQDEDDEVAVQATPQPLEKAKATVVIG